jgi:hypothetical protein
MRDKPANRIEELPLGNVAGQLQTQRAPCGTYTHRLVLSLLAYPLAVEVCEARWAFFSSFASAPPSATFFWSVVMVARCFLVFSLVASVPRSLPFFWSVVMAASCFLVFFSVAIADWSGLLFSCSSFLGRCSIILRKLLGTERRVGSASSLSTISGVSVLTHTAPPLTDGCLAMIRAPI